MSLTTMLFVPADRPERFEKAASSGADAVILDLEDAVTPENKVLARESVGQYMATPQTYVRANPAGSDEFPSDMEALARAGIRNVMLAKAETLDELDTVLKALSGNVTIVPLIETAVGLSNAKELASHAAVSQLAFGSLDFALDIGCEHTHDALRLARQMLVLASRLANKSAPIDGVTVSVDDAASITADANEARCLGFSGKLLIHPKQIAPVKRAFMPSERDIVWAKQVLDVVGRQGSHAVKFNGQMIDRPVIRRAETILERSTTD